MKEIKLTQNKITLVDDDDYEWLSHFKWQALRFCRDNRYWYAAHSYHHKNGWFRIWMSRIILDCPINRYVDHINHNTLDNRKENLRIVTPSQSRMNAHKKMKTSSRFKGVCWNKKAGKWQSQIEIEGMPQYLGLYDSELQAALVYDAKAKELFGEFALLNIKEDKLR